MSKNDRIITEIQRHRSGQSSSIPVVSKSISILANYYENYFDVLEEVFVKDVEAIYPSRQLSFHIAFMNQLVTNPNTLEHFRKIKKLKNNKVLNRLYTAAGLSVEGVVLMLEKYPEITTIYELHTQMAPYDSYELSYQNCFNSTFDFRSEELKRAVYEYQTIASATGSDLYVTSIALSLAHHHQNDTDMTEILTRAVAEGYELNGAKLFRFFHSWSQFKNLPLEWIDSLTQDFDQSQTVGVEKQM